MQLFKSWTDSPPFCYLYLETKERDLRIVQWNMKQYYSYTIQSSIRDQLLMLNRHCNIFNTRRRKSNASHTSLWINIKYNYKYTAQTGIPEKKIPDIHACGPPEYKSGTLTTELHRLSMIIHSSSLVVTVRIQGRKHKHIRNEIKSPA